MRGNRPLRPYPWRLGLASVIGLLVATIVGGVVALAINRHVGQVAEDAIGYDVELEDHADDLRVSVLDVRHFHRNLLFSGPSRAGVAEFQGAYAALLQQILELDQLGVRDAGAPQPGRLRTLAERYYAGFWPAVDAYGTDRAGFLAASDTGLVRLDRMEAAAQRLDKLGERRAEQAFIEVRQAEGDAAAILTAVLAILVLVAAVLAFTAVRILRLLQGLYTGQQQVAEDLARSLQEKADFLADVSHELRTPLTVLRGNAELGLAGDPHGPAAELFHDIAHEATRMSRLIEDLLFLARSQANVLRLDRQSVTAEPWLAELASRAEMLARAHGTRYATSVNCDCQVSIDRDRMEQAVLILVDNATTYTPAGKLVRLTARNQDDELVINVCDEGPGIPADQQPLVFQRFHRVHQPADTQQRGSGLGLAIAHSIVTAHEGRIEVHSQVGVGTCMRIRLPVTTASASPTASAGSPPQATPGQLLR